MKNKNNRTLPSHLKTWNYNHLADLKRSGITKEQANEAGFYPVDEHSYCIDYKKTSLVDEKPYFRIKNLEGGKRLNKYDSPKGAGQRAYILPEVEKHIVIQKRIPIFTEGEKKALKATLEGFPTIGLPGNFGYTHQPKDATRFELLPELKELLEGREEAIIIWDSDALEKWESSFRLATERLAALLDEIGTKLYLCIMPELDGDKTGVDDYFVKDKKRPELIQFIEETKKPVDVFKSRINKIPSWAKPWVFIADGSLMMNTNTGEVLKKIDFNNVNSYRYLGEDVKQRPVDWLCNTRRIEACYQMTYRPDKPTGIISDDDKRLLNIYKSPDHMKVDQSGFDNAKSIIEEHARRLTGKDDEVFLNYLAFLIQKPGIKINWSIIVQSVHGAGKSFFTNLLRGILGKTNVTNVDKAVIEGSFNDYLQSQLLIVEELKDSGSKYTLANKFKDLITSDTVRINPKGMRAYQQKNVSNFLCFTNYKDCLGIDQHERRWAVIFSPLEKREVNGLEAEGYYKRLFSLLDSDELIAGCYQYFMARDLSKFFYLSHAPETSGVKALKESSKSDLQIFIEEELQDLPEGTFPVGLGEAAAKVFGGHERNYRRRIPPILEELGYKKGKKVMRPNGLSRALIWTRSETL